MADQERAGARIAALRKTRGWTARELARRASVSYSLLAKVESGAAPASPALIGAVARALRVDVPRVTGQPYVESRGPAGRLHDSVNALRRSIDTYDLAADGITPRPFAELTADVTRISDLGQAARYVQIGTELPGLLDELGAAISLAPESERAPLFGLLAEAYNGRRQRGRPALLARSPPDSAPADPPPPHGPRNRALHRRRAPGTRGA
jgi:transcriptional regulator with XRE-family HTH domain